MSPEAAPPLPPDVAAGVGRFLAEVDASAPGLIAGFHIVGSVALGDYRPGRSDADFAAILSRTPEAADRRLLARAVRATEVRLDGPFLVEGEPSRPAQSAPPGLWTRDRRLRGPSGELRNPVLWAELARHAMTVRGTAARALQVHDDPEALDRWLRSNVATYWRRWLSRARPLALIGLLRPALIEWSVLGLSRIHATLAGGEILSKSAAGEYALRRFGADAQEPVGAAMASRSRSLIGVTRALQREALRFAASVAADALALPPMSR